MCSPSQTAAWRETQEIQNPAELWQNQFWSFWSHQNCHFELMSSSEFWISLYFWHLQVQLFSKNQNAKPPKFLTWQFLTKIRVAGKLPNFHTVRMISHFFFTLHSVKTQHLLVKSQFTFTYSLKVCGNYGILLSRVFGKKFVKSTNSLKNSINSTFDELFYWWE